jgi:putative endonuclease
MTSYFIYILQSWKTNKFYVGYSTDPWRRVLEHNNKVCNSYASKFRPWGLRAVFLVGTNESEAIRIERFIKKQKKASLILRLIEPTYIPTGELAQLLRVPHVRD